MKRNLTDAAYTGFLLRVGAWLEDQAWRDEQTERQAALSALPIAAFAAELLTRRRDKTLALGDGLSNLPTEKRHILRIALKKLRYAVEFFAPLFEKKAVKPFVKNLKALQDDLGHLNDVAMTETLLDALITRSTKSDIRQSTGLVIGWHDRGVVDLEESLLRDWSAFAEHAPFWT